jgi:hypothetical protein
MFSHFTADNVTADNAAEFAIAELTSAIAKIDSETSKNNEFIARQNEYLATSGGMFDNMTHEWIANTEECLAADARRRMVFVAMLAGLTA